MPRYFHSQLAARPLVTGGVTIHFDPIGIFGGCLYGITEVEEGPKLQVLASAASARKLGVTEISAEEYAALRLKKKAIQDSPMRSDSSLPPVSRGPTLTEKVGVAFAEKPVVEELSSRKILTPEDCIVLGAVNSPEPFVSEGDRMAPMKPKSRRRAA
jgi:hypothetical protein